MFTGKRVLLFGGMGLLGKKLTEAMVEGGASVVIASRSVETGPAPTELSELSREARSRISGIRVDVSDPVQVDAAFAHVMQQHSRLDAVVNLTFPRNAAFGTPFEEVRYEDFCENVTSHLGGAFLVCQKAAALFSQQGDGNIINVASIYGMMAPRFEIYDDTPMTKEVEYAVAKAAIIQLTKYLARYLKGRNIRVNCISPGGISDHQPDAFMERYNAHCINKGMLDVEDVIGVFLFLLSDQSRHINGQNLVVDDGFSL